MADRINESNKPNISKMKHNQSYDAVFHYMQNLGARTVAESGIPSDIYYLGKLLLTSLRTNPEWILQIDANTGAQESSKSVLSRSVRCARSMSRRGMGKGDVIIISAPHHLDQCIPMYAANYLGIAVYPIDVSIKGEEMKWAYENVKPKLIFCQNNIVVEVEDVLNNSKIKVDIVTMSDNEDNDHTSFNQFLEEADDGTNEDDFQAVKLDPEEAIAVIVSTGGTTGKPKITPITHKHITITFPYRWTHETEFPNTTRVFVGSPLQWLTGISLYYATALYGFTRVQTSAPFSIEHWVESIRRYKVNILRGAPWLMMMIINEAKKTNSTIPSLKHIITGGNVVTEELLESVYEIAPAECVPLRAYGMSKTGGLIFYPCNYPPNSVGKVVGIYQHRLVDSNTELIITEPFKAGELQLKVIPAGTIFKGYYNNSEGTAAIFTKDGWFKTGDLMYKDKNDFFYIKSRIKTLLQLTTGKSSPAEIEGIILSHPGVSQVVVVGWRQDNLLDLPVACVVRKPGANVTAQELKDLVKSKLTLSKHLTGGVVFLNKFPLTVTCKIDIKKIQDIVQQANRE